MKRICQTLLLLSVLLLPSVSTAQVRFDGNFEGGAFDRYALYRFVAVDCIEPEGYDLRDKKTGEWMDPGVHGWVYQETVVQERDGRFRYTWKAAEGEMADALLLINCDTEDKSPLK